MRFLMIAAALAMATASTPADAKYGVRVMPRTYSAPKVYKAPKVVKPKPKPKPAPKPKPKPTTQAAPKPVPVVKAPEPSLFNNIWFWLFGAAVVSDIVEDAGSN